MQELIGHLDGFMVGFKDSLTPNNYQALIGALATQVAMQFEKVILKTNFSRVITNAKFCVLSHRFYLIFPFFPLLAGFSSIG